MVEILESDTNMSYKPAPLVVQDGLLDEDSALMNLKNEANF